MDTALIVSSSASFVDLKKILSINDVVSDVAKSLREARIAMTEHPYSILIIDSPVSDGSAREFAIESASRRDVDVILLTNPAVTERVAVGLEKYGIYVFSKPVRENELSLMLRNLRVSRKRYEALDSRYHKLLKRLDEERTLTRAKCLLAIHMGFDEDEGHRFLERKAMDERVTILDAAAEIVMKYSR